MKIRPKFHWVHPSYHRYEKKKKKDNIPPLFFFWGAGGTKKKYYGLCSRGRASVSMRQVYSKIELA